MGLNIYSATLNKGCTISVEIERALTTISTEKICGLVFCGTSDTVPYYQLLDHIKSAIHDTLKRRVPVTLIPQPLLPDGGLSLEVYTLEGAAEVSIGEQEGICYGAIESDEESMLFIEGIPASDFADSVCRQSGEIFEKLERLLAAHGFAIDDIVRQWNYIGDIVSYRDGKQNYQQFNDVRSSHYAAGAWQKGYPAATGIGASFDGIVVGGIAFKKRDAAEGGIYPIDNPLQVAAHVYSKRVLIDDDDAIKSTPKFERAKLIETQRGACCFVSGTAAIRGEESVDADSATLQTIKTIENIEHLVSKENLERSGCRAYDLRYIKLHVFVKEAKDYAEVREVVERAYPDVATIYTVADVCRSELLVEIEGILIA